jgi:hypothetical protein
MELSWNITNTQFEGDTKAIRIVHYSITGKENEKEITKDYSIGFRATHDDSFIPFDSLDELTIIEWIKNSMKKAGAGVFEEHMMSVEQDIRDEMNVGQTSGLPF